MNRTAALLAVLTFVLWPACGQQPASAGLYGPPACPGEPRPAHPATPDGIRAEQEQGALLLHAIPSAEPLENFALDRARLARYGDCTGPEGCYWADLDAQFQRAQLALSAALDHRSDRKKPALVLDVDETSLSNYCEMEREDFGYIAPLYDAWSVSSAAATAVPGALRLFEQAKKAGVAVFFITGRPGAPEIQGTGPQDQTAATARNLELAGFHGWTGLHLRDGAERHQSTIEYKRAQRKAIVDDGYSILLSVGDQWSDLLGLPEALTSVKLPNPFYFIP